MGKITISEVAKILGVSKKTLMRWDESGKFSPVSRESPLRVRVYSELDVRNLKILLDHEERYRENLKRLRRVQSALNPYSGRLWLTHREGKLLEEEEQLIKEHEALIEEFKGFKPEIKRLYRKFFMRKK